MKALFLGGSGTISTDIVRLLLQKGWEVTVVNRGNSPLEPGAQRIVCDLSLPSALAQALAGKSFDVVADFHTFTTTELADRMDAAQGKTGQYIFISSASAYHKPVTNLPITESTPLHNPYWEYSRNKAACEQYALGRYGQEGYPVTIVRPSHTYNGFSLPLGVHGNKGSWQVLKRMLEGKPVLIHGDGSSLWAVTHARDFAKGFVGLMANPHALGEAVHITSDELLSWNDIHRAIATAAGVEYKPFYVPSETLARVGPAYGYDFEGGLLGDKAHSVIFDNTKLKRLVPGFAATTRFDEGARESVQNYLENKALQTPDEDFDRFCENLLRQMGSIQ